MRTLVLSAAATALVIAPASAQQFKMLSVDALEERDCSLGVDICRADAQIPRAQHGIVRRGVDGG